MSLVLSGSIGLGLLLAAFLLALGQVITARLTAWESRVEVVGFVPPQTEAGALEDIRAALEALPDVAQVTYTSPAEGWRELLAGTDAPPDLISAAEVGLVPGAFTLRVRPGIVEPAHLEQLAEQCAAVPGVTEAEFATDLLTRYGIFRRDLRRIVHLGLALLLVLLVGLSAGTIRLGLSARHAELRSWLREGAHPGFLSAVCATEAGLQGLLGSGWAICAYIVGEQFAMARWAFAPPPHWPVLGLLVVLGPALGVLASFLSTRRLAGVIGAAGLAATLMLGGPAAATEEESSQEAPVQPITTQEFDAQRLRKDLHRLQEQRELALREARRLGGQSRGLLGEIEQIGVIADTLQARFADLQEEAARLEAERETLQARIQATEAQHRDQGERVVALSRMLEWTPAPTALSVFLGGRPQGETIQLRSVRNALLAHRLEAFGELERAQRVLRKQRQRLETAAVERAELTRALAENIEAQTAARAERRALLQTVQAEQAIAAATAAEIEASVGELETLLGRLPGESDPHAALYGPVPFPALRGVLPWPLAGARLARDFGPHVAPVFLTVTQHDGWLLTPPEAGAPVRAVHDGVVQYHGRRRGDGKQLILDHRGGCDGAVARSGPVFRRARGGSGRRPGRVARRARQVGEEVSMRRPRGEMGFLMVAVLCIGLLIGEGISGRFQAQADDIYGQLEVLTEALGIIEDEYVEPVETQDLIYGALDGMLRQLDQYSQYMRPDMYKEPNVETRGHFGGLGIVIGQDDNDVLTVMSPIAGTPAAKAGILPGDKIIGIEGKSTVEMTLVEAVKLLRGPRGSKVTITILRTGEEEEEGEAAEPQQFDVVLTRAEIEIPSLKGELMDGHIGYVRLIEFKEGTARDLKKELADLKTQGMNALVLDLRNNPGGLLQAAAEVSDLFLDKGQIIVSTESRDPRQNMRFNAAHQPQVPAQTPIAILLNQGSASASEIVAGALKDHRRAVIIGEKSFGKGSVQSIIPLGDNSALRLTTAKYLTPDGISISGTGIMPDVEVKGSRDLMAQLLRAGARVSTPGI
ncbi:MAG: permease-like cell division protein FtsX, partial [Kiloniellaceae bacterium]